MESWLSGRKRLTANEVRVYSPSRVRIPYSPHKTNSRGAIALRLYWFSRDMGFEKTGSRVLDEVESTRRRLNLELVTESLTLRKIRDERGERLYFAKVQKQGAFRRLCSASARIRRRTQYGFVVM